ncbi:Myelin expression factor 2 [Oopsacas minuta]|uniref:Myelin expression factor 2 n=1 Tax=Oopsacas minuta TaxID=111878 RepID=A0AAV7JKW5_9METZ|nr:Myelin expression factor 2 [Oopsacas minuta]
MSFIYSQTRSDPYSDVLAGGRGEISLSSKLGHHSPSYFDAPSSLHHPDLKVVDSIEHDLKREYELEARRNYERERELEDEREVVGRGYLHEREELERERRAELDRDRDRRIDIRDRFERPSVRARNTKVVVDNLPYSVKWPEFKEFMKKAGEVIFADVFMDNSGKSKGCGIVEYANIESADRAMSELDGQDFVGRRISVREDRYPEVSEQLKRNAMGFSRGAPVPSGLSSSGASGDPACTVFVGNLDYEVSWQKLKDVFRVAGLVIRSDIFVDRDSRSRGYGTVEFSIPKEALNAIMLFHGQMLNNRPMVVRMDKANLHSSPDSSSMRMSRSSDSSRMPLSSLERKRREIALRELEAERMHEDRIVSRRYLDNFALGRDSIDPIRRIRDPYDDILLSREFRRDSIADRYRDHDPLYHRDLLDYPIPSAKRSRMSLMNRTFSPPPPRRPGGEPFRVRKSDATGPNRTVFVRNLPYAVGWQELKDLFRESGLFVANADVAKDDFGKSRGFGLVTLESVEDAKLSIEKFDGFEMKGRKLEVRMDKF